MPCAVPSCCQVDCTGWHGQLVPSNADTAWPTDIAWRESTDVQHGLSHEAIEALANGQDAQLTYHIECCGTTFKTIKLAASHLDTHDNACPFCPYQNSPTAFKNHLALKHGFVMAACHVFSIIYVEGAPRWDNSWFNSKVRRTDKQTNKHGGELTGGTTGSRAQMRWRRGRAGILLQRQRDLMKEGYGVIGQRRDLRTSMGVIPFCRRERRCTQRFSASSGLLSLNRMS